MTADRVPCQVWVGESRPTAAAMNPVTNQQDPPHKPSGGLWTSTHTCDEPYPSRWVEWLARTGMYNATADVWLLEPRVTGGAVLTIDSHAQLASLVRAYPAADGAAILSCAALDFEAMAADASALHLTARGQQATRHTRPGLYGWDVETYLWFEWPCATVERIGPITDYV